MVHFSSKGRTVDNFDREQPKENWKEKINKLVSIIVTHLKTNLKEYCKISKLKIRWVGNNKRSFRFYHELISSFVKVGLFQGDKKLLNFLWSSLVSETIKFCILKNDLKVSDHSKESLIVVADFQKL